MSWAVGFVTALMGIQKNDNIISICTEQVGERFRKQAVMAE